MSKDTQKPGRAAEQDDRNASYAARPVSILMLEDDRHDAELVSARLSAEGIAHTAERVDAEADFEERIANGQYDLIISDYSLPSFNGLAALERVCSAQLDTPFIFVSGRIGEERAVAAMKRGATDYVCKNNLDRLLPVVRRALDEHSERRKRREAELALREAEARFHRLVNCSPSVIYSLTVDAPQICTFVSDNFFEVTGYTSEQMLGSTTFWSELVHPDDLPRTMAQFNDAVANGRGTMEYRFRHADGHYIWIHDSVHIVREPGVERPEVVGSWTDVTEAHELSEELTYQATHDPLTGLANRTQFDRTLRQLIANASAECASHVLCYLDLDQFKIVNDTCGHVAGDELLKRLSHRMRGALRRTDLLARLGGDEFGLLLHYCDVEQGARLAEKLRRCIDEFRLSWEGRVFRIGVSIGVVTIDRETEGSIEVMRMADEACYLAKEAGRDRIHVLEKNDVRLSDRRTKLDGTVLITDAFDNDRFRLFFQPIAHVGADEPIRQGEVLLRLQDESGEMVSPGRFLPAAERFDLTGRIDRWVVEETLRFLSQHELAAGGYRFSVNLSGQTLSNTEMLPYIIEQIHRHDVDPGALCFEITETAAICNLEAAITFIDQLHGIGCRFALDDFGTGMSSFAYLKNLVVDYIKIDGSFVRNLETDALDQSLVRAITDIGHQLGAELIAEYVETPSILRCLEALGVDYAQGYAIGRPAPINAYFAEKVA